MNTNDNNRPRVALMMTADSHPQALAIARVISSMPEEHERRANEVRERAKAELEALDKEFQARHEQEWGALQDALGLDHEPNYSLCTEHLDVHGVAFITEREEQSKRSMPGGIDIGRMIAEALGRNDTDARIISEDDNGSVIEVKM